MTHSLCMMAANIKYLNTANQSPCYCADIMILLPLAQLQLDPYMVCLPRAQPPFGSNSTLRSNCRTHVTLEPHAQQRLSENLDNWLFYFCLEPHQGVGPQSSQLAILTGRGCHERERGLKVQEKERRKLCFFLSLKGGVCYLLEGWPLGTSKEKERKSRVGK